MHWYQYLLSITSVRLLSMFSLGEHGIGIGKKEFLVPEHGKEAVDLMRQLKRTLDPKNLLNPGKVIDA